MEPETHETGPTTAEPQQRGWFMRLPLWLRIAGPAVLVILLVGGITAVVVSSQRRDPVDVARSVCLSGVSSDLAAHDRDSLEMPLFRDVKDVGDGSYRTQGVVRFTDSDGEERSVTVRCIARLENGAMRVASIRFSP
ncbi:hypothetical protein J2X63_003601 [Agromyces sp. 3263]|uniref:hypothetical protein n=1 Tax=Agromyces sp. 3263 TaxID=2817750 RepID=UPI0028580A14|nr:hypothetical protein [Agromyces sp. 3263]MDR6907893.1 hypothetical protein [Agromyces sp. 3263]